MRRERARVERALAFARDVGSRIRLDFQDLFQRPQAWAEGTTEQQLVGQSQALTSVLEAATAAFAAVPAEASLDTLQRLESFNLSAVADAAGRSQALADRLSRGAEPAPKPASKPAPLPVARPQGRPGPDVALIRGLAPRSRTQQLGPAPAARPGAGVRQGFDQAVKLAREVLAYVSPRLALADVALAATGLPGPRRTWQEIEPALLPGAERAGVIPPLRPWLPILAQLYLADMGATRKTHQAVTQWKQAQGLGQQADGVDRQLAQAPLVSHAALLASVDTARLRAAVYPLSHLHLHFRGVPHMTTLFPPPS